MKDCKEYFDTIVIHKNVGVIRQRHVAEEAGPMTGIGSTKKGCGAAIIEKIRRDLGIPATINEAEISYLQEYGAQLGAEVRIVDTSEWLDLLDCYDRVQIEGAQGFSIGMNAGFYPYTTSRECTPAQICSDCLISPSDVTNIVGCMRTYPIRVANRFNEAGDQIGYSGPVYPDQEETTFAAIGVPIEHTTVTKLPRRIFTFSEQQTRDAIRVVRPNEIFLNFANYCSDTQLSDIQDTINVECCNGGVQYLGYGPTVNDIKITKVWIS